MAITRRPRNFETGAYVPALTNTTNVAASTAFLCQYTRYGDVVTVSGKVTVDPTAAAATELRMSLPITSLFTAEENAAGTAIATDGTESYAVRAVVAASVVAFVTTTVGLAAKDLFFQFTYRVQ